MNPWFFAIMNSARQQVTQTFTANATWVAPFTTNTVDPASGKGQDGTPGIPAVYGWYVIYTTTFTRRDGSGTDQTASQGPNVFDGSPTPSNYCDPTIYYTPAESSVYSDSTKCYSYFTVQKPGTGIPGTVGANTTAFGKTFPGGNQAPATTTTFNNIAVTPNGSYNIVVPSGGSLTITYWK